MRSFTLIFIVACAFAQAPRAQQPLIAQYCIGCHNEKLSSGGLNLGRLDVAHPSRNTPEWEKVILKLRTGMMPPAGAPRPSGEALAAFAGSIESQIDAEAAADPNPGRPALHRLNRVEYGNSVRDLLGIEIDPAAWLPADDSSHGFDNMAEVLTVSPTLMEGYLRAAGKISRLAIGDASMKPASQTYHLPSTLSQTRHVEGAPFGTRGGISVVHNFPADGEYVFRMTLYFTTNTFVFGTFEKGEQLEISVNGERVALLDVNPAMKVDDDLRTPPIKVKAGPQTVSAAFIRKASGPVVDVVQPYEHTLGDLFAGRTLGVTALPHLRDLAINGPYRVTGVSETPARRRIFTCRPSASRDELPCARRILSSLARQGFRRPVTESDLEDLLGAYQAGRREGGFESGIRDGLHLILASPHFVFRFEPPPPHAAPGSIYRISDIELASRLSYFLWSSAPDESLLDIAMGNGLHEPAMLEQQVRRMLADSRSRALAENFAGQWLELRNLKDTQADLFLYPNFSYNLTQSMRRETELLFDSMVRDDRAITTLLDADYTFVDEVLAKHYGIPNVEGSRFRRVPVTDPNRRGLLGHASILTVTSFANRTSPVLRGKWVIDTLLGAPVPKPPANVPPLKENTAGAKALAVRARLEEHRANAACAACHKIMDPAGFALENFDAIGAWRTSDSGFPVDPTGQLVDGAWVDGPQSLREALLRHSDAFTRNFATKLLTYALGRGVEYFDMPVVRRICRDAAASDNRFSAFVLGIAKSTPFQMKRMDDGH
jgi:Protein of unknown function (DUF1592)/Protein of unknown function (DUF1588)/Protein of unknown function (DUF1587)/Protein of unknown function (DUF1585)/Protein of unknown function (DUF1595)